MEINDFLIYGPSALVGTALGALVLGHVNKMIVLQTIVGTALTAVGIVLARRGRRP